MRILDVAERVYVLQVRTLNWQASGNAASGEDKGVIRNRFFTVLKSNRFVGSVHRRGRLFCQLVQTWLGGREMRTYRVDTESNAIFDLEISRCAPLELGRIGDERFAQLGSEM